MVAVKVEGARLVIEPSRWEAAGGLIGNFSVPLAEVTKVETTDEPLSFVHGLRVGVGLPKTRIGSWYHDGVKDYIGIRDGRPAVVVTLMSSSRFSKLVISVADPATTATQIRSHAAI